ncbi:hypothetical protein HWV62_42964 [Athelia sp. TMB]|nr:hypothetical protein HWV62_42964 [Athelia sp. TMB]
MRGGARADTRVDLILQKWLDWAEIDVIRSPHERELRRLGAQAGIEAGGAGRCRDGLVGDPAQSVWAPSAIAVFFVTQQTPDSGTSPGRDPARLIYRLFSVHIPTYPPPAPPQINATITTTPAPAPRRHAMAAIVTPDDAEYLLLRDELFQDAARDQRIHHWISSQYDFALSELELDDAAGKCGALPPSRADSPLLGFGDAYTSANTSRASSLDAECPSYDPLFFTPTTRSEGEHERALTAAEAEFEDAERERALKHLIAEMHSGRAFPGPAREKALPALPHATPHASPARSRTSLAHGHKRASRMPSISSTLSALPAEPVPALPSCTTPTPGLRISTSRSRTTTLAFTPPVSPAAWTHTSPPGTPALSFSSPPVSPATTRFSRRTGSIESALNAGMATLSDDDDEYAEYGRALAASFDYPAQQHLGVGAAGASQSRWSLGSSVLPSEPPAEPSTRRRLKSLISLLSPHPMPAALAPEDDNTPAPAPAPAPKLKSKSSLASLGYHRRSQLPPPRDAPPTPTIPTTTLAAAFPSVMPLPPIAQSPASPTFPSPPPPKLRASTSTPMLALPTPTPIQTPPPSPPRKHSLLAALRLKRAKKSKKRTLVLSAPAEAHPALLAWCRDFGEVSAFRADAEGGGDVHVEFASARVAETVCRVRGEVCVGGWSVRMGWF